MSALYQAAPPLGVADEPTARGASAPGPRVAVTVDVEGDFGTESLRGVDQVLPWLLDRFDELGVRATLFTVGEVALRRPAIIRLASERGHLVASHAMTHTPFSRIPTAKRRDELHRSRATLEEVTGRVVDGFRAPFFDLPDRVGPLLEEAGYRWSSSKAPFSFVKPIERLVESRRPHSAAEPRRRDPGARHLRPADPRGPRLPPPAAPAHRGPDAHPARLLPPPLRASCRRRSSSATSRGCTRCSRSARATGRASTLRVGLLSSWKRRGAIFLPPDPDAIELHEPPARG